jgi:hypothetical protein
LQCENLHLHPKRIKNASINVEKQGSIILASFCKFIIPFTGIFILNKFIFTKRRTC